jgi:glycosyltransferase involved in cell wall biosynthesis
MMTRPSTLETLLDRRASPGENIDLRRHLDRLALTWKGVAFNYSGYARVTRELLPALAELGVPVALDTHDEDEKFVGDMNTRPEFVAHWNRFLGRKHRQGVQVCFHPAVSHQGVDVFGLARARRPGLDAYAGYTMFETDRLPRGWAESAAKMDRVLTPSHFSREAFLRAGLSADQVRRLPHGLDWAAFDAAQAKTLREGGAPRRPDAACVFLSVFEWSPRKGADILLDAWLDSFTRQDDVALWIRSYRSGEDRHFVRRQIEAHLARRGTTFAEAPRIELIEGFVPEEAMPALYAAADAFVLPTRGEGWGLPFLEAMGAGLPTIATNWSGQLDFMNDDRGLMIEVEDLEPVGAAMTASNPYYESDHLWARPSKASLCDHLRWVYENRSAARALGAEARRAARRDFGSDAVARIMVRESIEMIEEAAEKRRGWSRGGHEPARLAWIGPLYDRCGYAEEGRHLVSGLAEIGETFRACPVPLSLVEEELDARTRSQLRRGENGVLGRGFATVQHLLGHQVRRLEVDGPQIARTMFEGHRLPLGWVNCLAEMDEIWVPSAFNVESFARAGLKTPTRIIHEALDAAHWRESAEPLLWPGRRGFNVLSVFDWSLRKGWDLLLRAWAEAFAAEDDVALVLKTGSSRGHSIENIAEMIGDFCRRHLGRELDEMADIVLLDWSLPSADMRRLYAGADCFCLPSRGEGWGRPYMEALASGLPVIATDWGGATEFLHADIAEMVPARVVPVTPAAIEEVPYFKGQHWAEADHGALVDALRRVRRDRKAAEERARRGRTEILTRFDRPVVARQIREALDEIL